MGDLVEVAFVADEFQAGMIQALLEGQGIPSVMQRVTPSGPQLGYGLMNPGGGACRVMVHPERADQARVLIEAATAEGESLAEPVNAEYLADAAGRRRPRNYGVIGAYLRAFGISIAVFALIFGIWFLFRVL